DVTLEDVTDTLCILHVFSSRMDILTNSSGIGDEPVSARHFGHSGIDYFLPRELLDDVRKDFSETFVLLDAELADVFRIEAGIPKWGAELDENTLPQEAGKERDAIDFHKGCYVGQEVISRIKSVGHVNRSLRGFVSDSPLAAGMKIFASNEGEEKPVGYLTSAAWSCGLEKWAALGYLKRGFQSPTLEARAVDGS